MGGWREGGGGGGRKGLGSGNTLYKFPGITLRCNGRARGILLAALTLFGFALDHEISSMNLLFSFYLSIFIFLHLCVILCVKLKFVV